MTRLGTGALVGALLLGGCYGQPPDVVAGPGVAVEAPLSGGVLPLEGRTVVVDPGHQLGNKNFPEQVNRPVPAGGFTKPCNTTGTATDAGFPEATFTWKVARVVRRQLEQQGAEVLMTRSVNSEERWGPCVDERGRAGNEEHADLKLSIHGDGSYAAGAHGFHVIAPTNRRPWTHDIYRSSRRLALAVRAALHRRAGLDYATYAAGGDGLDFRADLGTLNLSDVPTVVVELGNMRDTGDAALMSGASGRKAYAEALVRGAKRFLAHGG